MGKKILYGLVGVLLIGIAFAVSGFLINSKPAPKIDSKKHNVMYVKASNAIMVETDADLTYRGSIAAFDKVSLAAEVSGKIMQGDVRFKAGESFRKGDILIHIYSEDVKASLKSGKSGLLQTLSQILPDLKVDYPNEFAKWNNFFNSIDVDKSLPGLPEINSSKEKVFLAANNVLSAYYSLQQQKINLERYTICAPFTGIFKSVSKEIGAISSPGSELATIIRSDKLEVVVPVFPSDLKWISKGDKVKIIGDNGAEQTATVSRISGFIEDQSVNVYLTYLASGNKKFLEGEFVDAIFSGSKVSGFEIPREAIVDKNYVYELSDKKLQKIRVEIKRQLDDTFIISGVDASKVIVTESLASVNPNMEYLAR
jgi:multidrug efflux pump subunit AcrA (membrane-fusion protein)